MAKVLVSTNSQPIFMSEINLASKEWSCLLEENISAFRVEEIRRVCNAFPNGLFKGAELFGDNKQLSRIQRFPNYIEYSKIVSDEVVPLAGQLYMTTKFFDRRAEGWASKEIKKKQGEVIGYCLNGDVYCAADKNQVDKVFYLVVYKSLVEKELAFQKLLQMLKDGLCLCLTGTDEEFMNHLKDVLLDSVKTNS